jgi:multicomponent Na+:H+ antiporter subunit D
MLLAMGITAFFCVAIGVYPAPLYAILPFEVAYVPYTAGHVITQLQLLLFSALAFAVLMRTGLYPPELRSTNLDTDWLYRKAAPAVLGAAQPGIARAWQGAADAANSAARRAFAFLNHAFREGYFAREHATGTMALIAIAGVALYLFVQLAFF